VRSPLALRCSTEQNALHTLIHQRHLTPSCGGHAPTAERTLDPARIIGRELDPRPGIREQPGSEAEIQLGHLQLSRDCFNGESVVLSARPKTVCRRHQCNPPTTVRCGPFLLRASASASHQVAKYPYQSPGSHVSAMVHLRPSRVFVTTHLVRASLALLTAPSCCNNQRSISARFPTWL
jgi:hypothetical protein